MTAISDPPRQRRPFVVCRDEELPPGTKRLLTAGRRRVVVAHVPGQGYVALSSQCPHQGGALDVGLFEPMWVADKVGEHLRDTSRWVLICPFHNFETDVRTGCPVAPLGRRRVPTYQVQVEDGNVVVYL